MTHIAVLLSSFNGEAYIEEQVLSIINQCGVTVSLVVRDDGSTDKTLEILRRLTADHANITFSSGKNLGVAQSFFALMQQKDQENSDTADYFALADQDDVWLPEKLLNAVTELQKVSNEKILMYCSAIEYVDANLNHLANSQVYAKDKIGFNNALVQNCATGCTIVLNKVALSKIARNLPDVCVMHDWWIYLLVSAFGGVIYDPRPGMKYRQHGRNVMGVAQSPMDKFKRRWNRLFSDSMTTKTSEQLIQFERIFADALSSNQQLQVHRLAHYKESVVARLAAICRWDYYRQDAMDNLLIRLTMLLGKF